MLNRSIVAVLALKRAAKNNSFFPFKIFFDNRLLVYICITRSSLREIGTLHALKMVGYNWFMLCAVSFSKMAKDTLIRYKKAELHMRYLRAPLAS